MAKAIANLPRRDYQTEVSARILAELERGALPWVGHGPGLPDATSPLTPSLTAHTADAT
jgi:antirestriction protein ArdC